jgi:hypothetical protein
MLTTLEMKKGILQHTAVIFMKKIHSLANWKMKKK